MRSSESIYSTSVLILLSHCGNRYDRFYNGIEKLRRYADPKHGQYSETIADIIKSMNDTLVSHIQ